MMTATLTKVLSALLAVALVTGLVLVFLPGDGERHLTAQFPRTVSLYAGSDVRILGVKVGTVDKVTPAGTKVAVQMSYDAKYKVPRDAKAVIVSPSIVGDRFVQLTPVYRSGAVMADGARLGEDRTATPLGLDEIYSSLTDLSKALGPDGANSPDGTGEGALTRILDSTARNFDGQGVQANQTIENFSRLTSTLDDNKDNLFGTARELEQFVKTLSENDTTVRQFNDSLAKGADLLAGERQDLAAALRNLGTALVEVRQFVQSNKDVLSSDIKNLNRVTQTFVNRRDQLEEILKVAPVALSNLGLVYNPKTGTLDQRVNLGQNITQLLTRPSTVLCSFLNSGTTTTGNPGTGLGGLGLTDTQCQGLVKNLGLNRAGALSKTERLADDTYVDRSMAGLLAVKQ